ncbi:MAG TPA: DUF1579 family protein [Gemmatimonadales bacterium]|nr:DUF1579 family protein [Gemmatimonadales bacterium]
MLAATPGLWAGTKQLWFDPSAEPFTSEVRAVVNAGADGQYLTIAYEWSHDGVARDGVLSVRLRADPAAVAMTWVDSFHQASHWLLLAPTAVAPDRVAALGHYPAPTGPDWGWSIEVASDGEDALHVTMHNIEPAGEPALAVRLVLVRQGTTLDG